MAEQFNNEPSIDVRMAKIDNMFRMLEVKTGDIIQQKQNKKQQSVINSKNFNSRGQILLSPKEIRENYDKAFYFFKWYQLPFCRTTIKRKVSFWGPASVVLAWTYGEYHKKKSPTNIIEKLPFKFYLKTFAVFFTVTTAYCFAQSLLFDEFCDIQSPFYQQNETRLSIARRIRGQIKGNNQASFLREMF